MMETERILWQPNDGPQTDFLACPAREVLYAGSVGAGKTDGLLMAAASQVGNGVHRALILRRTFPMLRDVIARSHELFLPLGAQYRKAENQWTFPSGAVIEFGYLDADGDEFRYMGRAFSFIGWDELTTWPGDGTDGEGQPCSRAYLYMLSRLRAVEGSGLRMEVRATCTPGGIGHNWVRARWRISDDGGSCEVIDPQTGYRRVFIRATIADNPFLAGTSYERSLAALPETTRKALLLGRWDVFEGAVFSEWDHKIHVCDPFPVPAEWPMWRGADDGYAAPACVLWFAHDEIYGRLYVVQELYRSGMTPEVMAAAVLGIDGQLGRRGSMRGVIDSASFADTGLGGGRGDQMNKLGCRWRPSEKGPGSRLAGKALIHARLALRSDAKPGLVVFRACRNLIRTLPALPYSKSNPEDISGNCEDHAVEALRIGLTRKKTRARLIPMTGI
ncbi:MAG: hypothetical protein ABIR21_09345 [Chthoniobacterales bacterium]